MTIPVILHVRTNIDWRTMTEEAFLRQEDVSNSARAVSAEQKQRFLAAIRLWNRTFGMSYFDFRQRLKEIAELSWTRIRNLDAVVRVPELMPLLSALERYIVLPVDDDDWFHPEVADALRRRWRPEIDVFHWPETFYRPVPSQDRFDAPGPRERLIYRDSEPAFGTNAYALTRAGLLKCGEPLRERVLALHLLASRTFYGAGFERVLLDRPLSASNKSLASCTNLHFLTDRQALMRNAPHLTRRATEIPPPLAWAADYIARTDDLNAQLCGAAAGARRPPSNRLELLNYLVRTRGFQSYLEIGCDGDRTFAAVAAPHKVGVDPRGGGTLRTTSDDFFRVNRGAFDLVFIDGLHHREQVLRDVRNSLAALRAGGCVVLHDCLPKRREHQERRPVEREWTGDVWKAVVELRRGNDCDVAVLDADWGLGVVLPRPNSCVLSNVPELTWETFVARRDELLRVLDFPRLERFLADQPDPAVEGAIR